jgi:hypothetical protein
MLRTSHPDIFYSRIFLLSITGINSLQWENQDHGTTQEWKAKGLSQDWLYRGRYPERRSAKRKKDAGYRTGDPDQLVLPSSRD